jgi:hypothetical protein
MGNVGEASGHEGRNTTANHAVETQGQQSSISSPTRPVQWVIDRVLWLGFENNGTVICFLLVLLLLLVGLFGGGGWSWRCWARTSRGQGHINEEARGNRRMRGSGMDIAQAEGLVAIRS